jgi:hypothetical protein
MALLDGLLRKNVITGLAIGVGVIALAPIVLPGLVRVVKPAAKAALKGGLVVVARGREALAELGEATEDILAEAKAELAEEAAAAMAAPGAAAAGAAAPVDAATAGSATAGAASTSDVRA